MCGPRALRSLGGEEVACRALPYLRQAGLLGAKGAVDMEWLSAIMEAATSQATHFAQLAERVAVLGAEECGRRLQRALREDDSGRRWAGVRCRFEKTRKEEHGKESPCASTTR